MSSLRPNYCLEHIQSLERRYLLSGEPRVILSEYYFDTSPHEVRFKFDQDISASLAASDLVLKNIFTAQTVPTASTAVTWDAVNKMAKFTFPGYAVGGVLPDGNYLTLLSAAGITNTSGQSLVGDHDSEFHFYRGDFDGDRSVNLNDHNLLAPNFNQSGKTYKQGDADYDGTVDIDDFNIMAGRFNTDLAPPAAAGQISVTATSATTIALQWPLGGVTGELGWRLQISTDSQNFVFLKNLDPGTTTHTVTGLDPGTRYWFRVRAYGNGQDTAYSPKQAATTVMPTPTGLTAQAISRSQADATWNDISSNEVGFEIEVSGSAGTYTVNGIPATPSGVGTFMVSDLASSTTYTMRVRTWGPDAPSAWSLSSSAITTSSGNSGAAPTGLTGTRLSSTTRLGWFENASNEIGYKVEKRDAGASQWVQIALIAPNSSTHYYHASVPGYWRVRAYTPSGNTEYSNVVSTVGPEGLQLTPVGNTEMNLSWSYPGSDATSFVIERAVLGSLPRPQFAEPTDSNFPLSYEPQITSVFETIGRVDADARNFTASGLADGQGYVFRVLSLNDTQGIGFAQSSTTSVVTTISKAPTALALDRINPRNVALKWTDNSEGNDGVEIRSYAADGTPASTWRVEAPNVDRYTASVQPEQTYQFEVLAYAKYGSTLTYSDPSNRVVCTTPAESTSLPYVSVSKSGFARESGSTAVLTVSRNGPTGLPPLTVDLYPSYGTTRPGTDHAVLPTTVTIPSGAPSTTIPIDVFSDWVKESNRQYDVPSEQLLVGVRAGSNYMVPGDFTTIDVYDDGPIVSTVNWEAINSPITLNPGNGTAGTAIGERIYPDYLSYDDTVDRRRVNVKVSTSPPTSGKTIYFKLFDVDDQTAASAPLDDESQENDNVGAAALSGVSAVTNSSGQASVELTVSRAPLDNYVVVASTDQTYLASLRNVDQNLDAQGVHQYIGNERGPAVGAQQMAAMLQVNRTLTVEVDSMGAEPAGFNQWDPDDDLLRGDIADPVLDYAKKAFGALGIKVVRDETQNSNSAVEWRYHFNNHNALDDFVNGANGVRQIQEKQGFGAAYVIGMYELGYNGETNQPGDNADNDPNTEFVLPALTLRPNERRFSMIYEKVIRDLAAEHGWNPATLTKVRQIATAHELGHWFALEHSAGEDPQDIMWAPTAATEAKIKDMPARFKTSHAKLIRELFP